jgi:hypothetical protein
MVISKGPDTWKLDVCAGRVFWRHSHVSFDFESVDDEEEDLNSFDETEQVSIEIPNNVPRQSKFCLEV